MISRGYDSPLRSPALPGMNFPLQMMGACLCIPGLLMGRGRELISSHMAISGQQTISLGYDSPLMTFRPWPSVSTALTPSMASPCPRGFLRMMFASCSPWTAYSMVEGEIESYSHAQMTSPYPQPQKTSLSLDSSLVDRPSLCGEGAWLLSLQIVEAPLLSPLMTRA